MKIFTYFTLISVSILFLGVSCRKETDNGIKIELKIQNRSDNKATISWTNLNTGTEKFYTYSVYLNSDLIVENTDAILFNFNNLIGKTKYVCRVVVNGTKVGETEAAVEFTTFENYPPNSFEIITDSITNTSVLLDWSKSDEPEKRPLRYSIYLNNKIYQENFLLKKMNLTGLESSKIYSIRIVAIDDQNNTTTSVNNIKTLSKANAILMLKTLKWSGVQRSYAVYLPSQQKSQMPLVIFFHGAGGFAWPEIQTSGFKDIADNNNFILVYPQATIWDQPTIPSWNVVDFIQVDDIGFVGEMLKQLILNFPVDEKRVYACGMSSGGFMTYHMAFKMGDKLAAIAPVAGLPTTFDFESESLTSMIPLMHIHGTADATVSMNGGNYSESVDSTIAYWVRRNHCSSTPVIRELNDTYPNDGSTVVVYEYKSPYFHKDVVFYKIINGGHSWPGSPNDSYANRDINANQEIWNFFRKYARE